MLLKLSIFSGGLFFIDLILLGLVYFVYTQAKKEAKATGKGLTGTTMFVIGLVVLFAWIVSLIWRAYDI